MATTWTWHRISRNWGHPWTESLYMEKMERTWRKTLRIHNPFNGWPDLPSWEIFCVLITSSVLSHSVILYTLILLLMRSQFLFCPAKTYAFPPFVSCCCYKAATTSERPFTVEECACPWQQATKAPSSSPTIWSWTWSRRWGSAVMTSLLSFRWTVWQKATTCRQTWKVFWIISANILMLMSAAGSSWSLWRYHFSYLLGCFAP